MPVVAISIPHLLTQDRSIRDSSISEASRESPALRHDSDLFFQPQRFAQKTCNIRMIKVCQYLPFVSETAKHLFGVHSSLYEFYGNLLLVLLVSPRGQIDSTHPSPSNFFQDSVWTDLLINRDEVLFLRQRYCSILKNGSLDKIMRLKVSSMIA
ncbi:hypothetical protein L0222_06025 [bacterium]|nr:hypothetical protein [bacterium]